MKTVSCAQLFAMKRMQKSPFPILGKDERKIKKLTIALIIVQNLSDEGDCLFARKPM